MHMYAHRLRDRTTKATNYMYAPHLGMPINYMHVQYSLSVYMYTNTSLTLDMGAAAWTDRG